MSAPAATPRVRPVEAAAGAALVLVGLSLRWYTASLADEELAKPRSGWQWLGLLDVELALVAAVGFVLGALVLVGRRLPDAAVWVLQGGVALGILCVAYRLVSPPDGRPGFVLEVSLGVGPFVVLAGLAALLASSRLPVERIARLRSSS